MSNRLGILVAILLTAVLLVSACDPSPATEPTVAPAATTQEPSGSVVESAAEPEQPTEEIVESVAEEPEPASSPSMELGPGAELDLIFVQHALCAWDSFWCVVEEGIEQAASDTKVSVAIWGPDQFDLEQTAQLIRRCRRQRITLGNVLSAAMLMSVHRKLYRSQATALRHFVFVNLRPYLVPAQPPGVLGCYFSPARVTSRLTADGELWALARALQEAPLDEEGLEHVLDDVALFADGRRQVVDADGAAVELVHDRLEHAAVHGVEALVVDAEAIQAQADDVHVDEAAALDLGEVAGPTEQAVGDPRRAPGASGQLVAGVHADVHAHPSSGDKPGCRPLLERASNLRGNVSTVGAHDDTFACHRLRNRLQQVHVVGIKLPILAHDRIHDGRLVTTLTFTGENPHVHDRGKRRIGVRVHKQRVPGQGRLSEHIKRGKDVGRGELRPRRNDGFDLARVDRPWRERQLSAANAI